MIWLFFISVIYCINGDRNVQEYCTGESFEPKCGVDEVVLMKHAYYGRMSVSRCANVASDTCVKNVLPWMHERCSGRFQCYTKIADDELNKIMPCTKDFMPYLEANYSCIPVVRSRKSQCSSFATISITPQITTLSSEVTKITGCGLPESPWTIQAKPGQHIVFNLLEFSRQRDIQGPCDKKYGYIMDIDAGDMVDICSHGSDSHIYSSKGHLVQVIFQENILQKHVFLLQVKAEGCPDFIPPNNAWMRKENYRIVVGCHGTSEQWILRCTGARWIGTYGQCPDDIARIGAVKNYEKQKMPTVVALTLIIATTLVVCTVAATAIIAFFCYRKYKIDEKETEYYGSAPSEQNIQLPNGTILSVKTLRPATNNRSTVARSLHNDPMNTIRGTLVSGSTLTGPIINGEQSNGDNFIEEVIYDDPANLDRNNVEYVNQFSSLATTGKNSLQYTKLQKR